MKQKLSQLLHEIQTPMTVVQGFIKMLKPSELSTEESRELLLAAQTSIEKIKSLLNQLREISSQFG
ncbi:MAG: hypothetical protein HYT75_04185 [Deltaproteobacteria bacterium]|nr:hypothetical protein [Deltaproteobacteria bacterium]